MLAGAGLRASADDTHYNGVPIGAHAIGLGSAFTGVADDGSAAWYNPGGLVLEESFGIAGSLSIRAFEWLKLSDGVETPQGRDKFKDKTQRNVPIFISAVAKFGPKDAKGRKRYALAYSTLQPYFSAISVKAEFPDGNMTDTFSVNSTDRATYMGLSFASLVSLRAALGVSLYYSFRRQRHREVDFLSGNTVVDGLVTTATSQSDVRTKANHFVLRFGWLQHIRENVNFGLMLQAPGIPLKQTSKATTQTVATLAGTPPEQRFEYVDDKFDARVPVPLELTAGVGYRPSDTILLSLDASFHGPVRDRNRIKSGGASPEVGGLFFNPSTERRPIANVAVGGDFYVSKKVLMELGLFTDLSAAPNIPSNPDRYYNPQINRFGGTVSVAFDFVGGSLALGTTYIGGKGDATTAFVDLENRTGDYRRTTATSHVLFLHVTGVAGATKRAGDATEEWVKERHGMEDESETETESSTETETEAEAATSGE